MKELREKKAITPEMMRAFRLHLGLTQIEMAWVVGVDDYGTVNRWERGKQRIPKWLHRMVEIMMKMPAEKLKEIVAQNAKYPLF